MVCSRLHKKRFRGAAALTAASAASQLLPLLVQPVLGRLVEPGAFSPYAVFTSVLGILGQGACLRYDYAALVCESAVQSRLAALTACAASVLTGAAAAVFLLIWQIPGLRALVPLSDDSFLGWIPLSLFLTGLGSALRTYAVRQESFSFTAWMDLLRAALFSGGQLLFCFGGMGAYGLLLGQIVGLTAGSLPFIFYYVKREKPRLFQKSTWQSAWYSLLATARSLRDFPRYLLPGALSAAMAGSLLPLICAGLYSPEQVSLTQRAVSLLGVPSSIVSSSFSQVVVKRTVDEKKEGHSLLPWFQRITRLLCWVGVPMFALLFFFGEPLVVWFLGDKWRGMGGILPYLIPLFAVRFVVIPVTGTPAACGDRKRTMQFQLLLPLSVALAGGAAWWGHWPVTVFLLAVTILQSAAYGAFWLYCRRTAKGGSA